MNEMRMTDLATQFAAICGTANVQRGDSIDTRYQSDWLGTKESAPAIVVRPGETAEVAAVMKLCAETRTPVIPFGGNSGLSGGTVARAEDQVVLLSLERMNKVRRIDRAGMYMVAEAGCIIQNLHQAVEAEGLMFPLVFGAKGTAQIGGALGTNAGGLNVIRHGSARALCMGLEVVTAAGEVMDLLPALKKNNTGYDLVNLMVGSEGTLGIITATSLKLVPPPLAQATAMVKVRDVDAALELMNMTQARTGGRIEAFELIGKLMYELPVQYLDHVSPVFDETPELAVLMELGAARREDAAPGPDGTVALSALLESILADAF